MAAPTYGAQGGAAATTTSASPSYPTGITAGMPLILFVSTNGSAMGSAPSGWTQIGATQVGGGMRCAAFVKDTTFGSESGTVTVSGLTGGTKGVAYIVRLTPGTGGDTYTFHDGGWADTDTGSTTFTGSGASWTSDTDSLVLSAYHALAPSGSYSSNLSSPTVTQSGATVSTTARFAGRTGTNTIAYGFQTASVSSGGTGAPSFSGTTNGANAAGVGSLVLVKLAPASVDATVTPSTVAAVVDVPSVTVTTTSSATVTPATVAAVAAVGTPTILAETSVTVTPATVQAIASVGTMQGATGATVAPATVAAVAGIASPTVSTGASATVTPSTVAAVAAVGSPTVTAPSNATVTVATVAALVAVGSPSVTAGANATVTPATVGVVAAVGTVTVAAATSVTVTPSTVTVLASVEVPSLVLGIDDHLAIGSSLIDALRLGAAAVDRVYLGTTRIR